MPSPISPPPSAQTAADYHRRTKHHPGRYAAGPHGLDWDDQPTPFRRYRGAPASALERPSIDRLAPFAEVADGRVGNARAVDPHSIAQLFGNALAISAWKRYGPDRWSLRCNPSSGNLHPTEAYLVWTDPGPFPAGLQLYDPETHALSLRCRYAPELIATMADYRPHDGFLVGLSNIAWREAWKYGERAWRYCQLDLGHALATLRYAAAGLGWRVETLPGWSDPALATLLGLDRDGDFPEQETELPEVLLAVGPEPEVTVAAPTEELLAALPGQAWSGPAEPLSPNHDRSWPVVDEIGQAAHQDPTQPSGPHAAPLPPVAAHDCPVPADTLLRTRRSAQAMDGATSLSRADFFRLLDHLLVRPGLPPWGQHPAQARIHLVLFVHRVDDLRPGLYLLTRHPDAEPSLRNALRDEFQWQALDGCPDHVGLRLLVAARAERSAAGLACQQAIAGNGAFAVAMLGEFDAALADGAPGYRDLFREAGLVGQALYLEAEAIGLQGTGIGCFFDDALHDLLGIADTRYQVMYQFTVGGAVVDTRIGSEPAYSD